MKFETVKRRFLLMLSIVLIGTISYAQGQIKAPRSSINEAAFMGNAKDVKGHIAAKTNLDQKDSYGSTALQSAATFGKTEIAILLIEGGANLNVKNAEGSTALHTAAFFGRTDIVKALLKNNADIAIRNNFNATALESVSGSFEDLKPIYDQMSKNLGPFGFKLNYDKLKVARPVIAQLIYESSN